jgi:hypothetical protein
LASSTLRKWYISRCINVRCWKRTTIGTNASTSTTRRIEEESLETIRLNDATSNIVLRETIVSLAIMTLNNSTIQTNTRRGSAPYIHMTSLIANSESSVPSPMRKMKSDCYYLKNMSTMMNSTSFIIKQFGARETLVMTKGLAFMRIMCKTIVEALWSSSMIRMNASIGAKSTTKTNMKKEDATN